MNTKTEKYKVEKYKIVIRYRQAKVHEVGWVMAREDVMLLISRIFKNYG